MVAAGATTVGPVAGVSWPGAMPPSLGDVDRAPGAGLGGGDRRVCATAT
jgi:hypothetical protein